MQKQHVIGILGAGSWGTAIAIHLARSGHHVLLWGHGVDAMARMQNVRCNERYLPDVIFPTTLALTADLTHCIEMASELLIAVPSHAFAEVLAQLPPSTTQLAWLTKGIDPLTHRLLSELVADKWGTSFPLAIISGPSFAREVAQNLPTALTLASVNKTYQSTLRNVFHNKNIRIYLSEDIIGVQLCGAVKNVLAIACGISDGLGFGANAKAALITRGLAEMSRLGMALGARQETFMGLAGLGDLVLTCTDDQSRNRRFGLQLGYGVSIMDAESKIGQVVEGKHNAKQVCALALQHGIEMPLCETVASLLTNQITPKEAVVALMTRPPKNE